MEHFSMLDVDSVAVAEADADAEAFPLWKAYFQNELFTFPEMMHTFPLSQCKNSETFFHAFFTRIKTFELRSKQFCVSFYKSK